MQSAGRVCFISHHNGHVFSGLVSTNVNSLVRSLARVSICVVRGWFEHTPVHPSTRPHAWRATAAWHYYFPPDCLRSNSHSNTLAAVDLNPPTPPPPLCWLPVTHQPSLSARTRLWFWCLPACWSLNTPHLSLYTASRAAVFMVDSSQQRSARRTHQMQPFAPRLSILKLIKWSVWARTRLSISLEDFSDWVAGIIYFSWDTHCVEKALWKIPSHKNNVIIALAVIWSDCQKYSYVDIYIIIFCMSFWTHAVIFHGKKLKTNFVVDKFGIE